MTAPIIKRNELTVNQDYKNLEQLINELPAGQYRNQVNTIKAHLIEVVRRLLFTKAEAERIVTNLMKSYIIHPYIEELTSGGLYNIYELQDNVNYLDHASRAFYLHYWSAK